MPSAKDEKINSDSLISDLFDFSLPPEPYLILKNRTISPPLKTPSLITLSLQNTMLSHYKNASLFNNQIVFEYSICDH